MRRNMDVTEDLRGKKKYATQLFTEEAVKIIKNRDSSKPLYLQINHVAPHAGNSDDPLQAPTEDIARYNYILDGNRKKLAGEKFKL